MSTWKPQSHVEVVLPREQMKPQDSSAATCGKAESVPTPCPASLGTPARAPGDVCGEAHPSVAYGRKNLETTQSLPRGARRISHSSGVTQT